MVGVVDTIQALRRAYEAGLDLVEVASDSTPPVCRILDYGKYKYEQAKKDKATKAKSKTSELKEVRLGRSMKIDPHDIQIRLNQAKKFLLEGHKVQIVQNFRGREMMHKDRGFQRMKEIVEQMSELAKVEIPPRLAGRRLTMILSPDKVKVEQYKRKLEKDKAVSKEEVKQDVAASAQPGDPSEESTATPESGDTAPKAKAKAKSKQTSDTPSQEAVQAQQH